MFEQFKENIHLTDETYTAAKRGIKSAADTFKSAPRFKKGLWMCVFGAILVSSIASKYFVPWYYQVILVFGIVFLPLWIWAGSSR